MTDIYTTWLTTDRLAQAAAHAHERAVAERIAKPLAIDWWPGGRGHVLRFGQRIGECVRDDAGVFVRVTYRGHVLEQLLTWPQLFNDLPKWCELAEHEKLAGITTACMRAAE